MKRLLLLIALAAALAPGIAASSEKAEKKKGGGATFLQIPTLAATIVRVDGRRGVIAVETGVDAGNPEMFERADQSLPRLRAAFAQVLQTYGATLGPGQPPNTEYLSRELQRQTDLVMGKPGAKLLLGGVLVN